MKTPLIQEEEAIIVHRRDHDTIDISRFGPSGKGKILEETDRITLSVGQVSFLQAAIDRETKKEYIPPREVPVVYETTP